MLIKSSRRLIKSEMSSRQYQNAIDKAARMIDEGERNVGAICKKTGLDEGDVQAMIDEQEELESITSSRKPVKSDWKREAEFMNDRIRDDNLLYQVFKIEDEHFGGNFENPDNWDGTHIVYTIENGEITNTEIVDSFEDVIDDGNKYYLSANRDTGYRNTDYVLDRVALWQERNNRGITSSRRPVKSSFVVGKTMDDGSKLYYCEDNCFYDENNYARPSIKIFDSKQEADKIAKRSKSGFVSPLEK